MLHVHSYAKGDYSEGETPCKEERRSDSDSDSETDDDQDDSKVREDSKHHTTLKHSLFAVSSGVG